MLTITNFICYIKKDCLHSTSTWKALMNFTFVLNRLHYMYPQSKLYNALKWRDLLTPYCKNTSITEEEKKSFSWHSKSYLRRVPAEKGGGGNHSNDQTVIYCTLVFHSQEATCHKLKQNKLQTTAHQWDMCVRAFPYILRLSHDMHHNLVTLSSSEQI